MPTRNIQSTSVSWTFCNDLLIWNKPNSPFCSNNCCARLHGQLNDLFLGRKIENWFSLDDRDYFCITPMIMYWSLNDPIFLPYPVEKFRKSFPLHEFRLSLPSSIDSYPEIYHNITQYLPKHDNANPRTPLTEYEVISNILTHSSIVNI